MGKIADFLTSNAALIVSVCALLLTFAEILTSRKHNKLSVKPLLTTLANFDVDPEDPHVVIYTVRLLNTGLGPAVIKDFDFLLDNVLLRIQDPRDLHPVLVKEFGENLVVQKTRAGILRKLGVLAKDQEVVVAQLAILRPTPVHRKAIDRFHLRVEFESAYGESFIYDSRLHKQKSAAL